MKQFWISIALIITQLVTSGQDIYTSRKGSKFFPGHLDIAITVESNHLRYELFNHWYFGSYAELRQQTIPLDILNKLDIKIDSVNINILDKRIQLIDKKFHINKKIRHRNLCTSNENMRKISYAYKVSSKYENVGHFELYKWEDLNLTEDDFKKMVNENLNKKITMR